MYYNTYPLLLIVVMQVLFDNTLFSDTPVPGIPFARPEAEGIFSDDQPYALYSRAVAIWANGTAWPLCAGPTT